MSDAWNNIFANVVRNLIDTKNAEVEKLCKRAVQEGYAALSLELQHFEQINGLMDVTRVLAGGRVVARVETLCDGKAIGIVPHWLGEEPNSEEDEARRTPQD